MSMPTADVSVRVAWSADADGIAGCQIRAWRQIYADLLPPSVIEELDPADFAEKWTVSMDQPGDARNRVLVALERATIRGFAVTAPSSDPDSDPVHDAEIVEFVIDPEYRRRGHGSRLLQACTDTMQSDRFGRATWWVPSTDDALRAFVVSTGWDADGAHRELDLYGDGTVTMRQVRLHTDLSPGDD